MISKKVTPINERTIYLKSFEINKTCIAMHVSLKQALMRLFNFGYTFFI